MSPLTAERVLIFGALYFMASPLLLPALPTSRLPRVYELPGQPASANWAQNQPRRRVFLPLPTKCSPDPVAGEADRPAQLQSH